MKTKYMAATLVATIIACFLNCAYAQNVSVETNGNLTIYYPHFSKIDLVTGKMPDKTDKSVVFVCAAAFTGQCLTTFSHSNIAGNHVSGGVYYSGYKCGPNNGVFTWSKADDWHFFNYGHANSVKPLKAVAAKGGMGYCQSLLIINGQQMTGCFKPNQRNQYRALCEIDGKLCIVDCNISITFSEFKNGLKELNVKNAIYCDMGTGWNYSWYRDGEGHVKEIFSTMGLYTTNWIVFYK